MDVQESRSLSQYSNEQKILVVGEGEFSFSLSLAKAFGSATNITAISLDIRGSSISKIVNHFLNFVLSNIENNSLSTIKFGDYVMYGRGARA